VLYDIRFGPNTSLLPNSLNYNFIYTHNVSQQPFGLVRDLSFTLHKGIRFLHSPLPTGR